MYSDITDLYFVEVKWNTSEILFNSNELSSQDAQCGVVIKKLDLEGSDLNLQCRRGGEKSRMGRGKGVPGRLVPVAAHNQKPDRTSALQALQNCLGTAKHRCYSAESR